MEASKLFVLVAICVTLSTNIAATTEVGGGHNELQAPPTEFLAGDEGSPLFFGRRARVLAHYRPWPPFTCDNYPGICRRWGSPGKDCCRRQCVDMSRDILNCGRCGRRCNYGEACCGGSCVNVVYDGRNCGACGNKCKKRSYCFYGMCSYA